MKEDIKRRAITGIDDKLIRDAYKPEEEAAEAAPRKGRISVVLKRAVLIATVAILTVFGLLMLNANVRAAILGVFVWDKNESFITMSFAGSETDDEPVDPISVNDVTVGYIPDGMRIVTDDIGENNSDEDPEGRYITLSSGPRDSGLSPIIVDISITIRHSSSDPITFLIDDYTEDGVGWEEYWSHTTIRGMDAMVRDNYARKIKTMEADEEFRKICEQEGIVPSELDGGIVYFGNSDIMVKIYGRGLTVDELIKIAEGVVW